MMNEKLAQLLEELKSRNPYPKDIFIEPKKYQWKQVHKIFKDNNLIQDKFFGSCSRLVWENCCNELNKLIIEMDGMEE